MLAGRAGGERRNAKATNNDLRIVADGSGGCGCPDAQPARSSQRSSRRRQCPGRDDGQRRSLIAPEVSVDSPARVVTDFLPETVMATGQSRIAGTRRGSRACASMDGQAHPTTRAGRPEKAPGKDDARSAGKLVLTPHGYAAAHSGGRGVERSGDAPSVALSGCGVERSGDDGARYEACGQERGFAQ